MADNSETRRKIRRLRKRGKSRKATALKRLLRRPVDGEPKRR